MELAGENALILVAGRYEGVDERLLEAEVDEELSIGRARNEEENDMDCMGNGKRMRDERVGREICIERGRERWKEAENEL